MIEQINNDYQTFLLKRDLTLNHIKESTKKTTNDISADILTDAHTIK